MSNEPVIITICDGRKQTWPSRSDAKDFFLKVIAASEGSELSRYAKIYAKLTMGYNICSDEE